MQLKFSNVKGKTGKYPAISKARCNQNWNRKLKNKCNDNKTIYV